MFQGTGVNSEGPAGTGKTETAKDFYSHLGRRAIVINMSDQVTADTMGKICKAAKTSGDCVCFDEFNRLCAEHMDASLEHLRSVAKPQYGLSMSMNPGYAGRVELPESFYQLFSRLTMFFPDYPLIAQVMLHKEGFGLGADKLCY